MPNGTTLVLTTWNMNGAYVDGLNKWTTAVQTFMKTADIVCLQECGTLPGSSDEVKASETPSWLGKDPPNDFGWNFAAWRPQSKRFQKDPYYILWGGTDRRLQKSSNLGIEGGKVNLAICSKRKPEYFLFAESKFQNARPAIGISYKIDGKTVSFYTVHAWSRLQTHKDGGADAESLILAISDTHPADQFWAALGDYNRQIPFTLKPKSTDKHIKDCPSNFPTRKDRSLDYMYWSRDAVTLGDVNVRIMASDHRSVTYSFGL